MRELGTMAAVFGVDGFSLNGFARLDAAGSPGTAAAARSLLWQQIGLSPTARGSWRQPVVWASDLTGAGPFGALARSPRLADALDRICGPGGWVPRHALGNIPIRFPVHPPADDRGWHIDLNTPLPDGSWAVTGRPHTMLLLTLLSDVGPDDAPTRIRVGSHHDVAAALVADLLDAVQAGTVAEKSGTNLPVAHATETAGDM